MKVQETLLLMLYGSLKENLNAFRVNNVVEGSIYNQKLADQIPKLGWKSINRPDTSFRSLDKNSELPVLTSALSRVNTALWEMELFFSAGGALKLVMLFAQAVFIL